MPRKPIIDHSLSNEKKIEMLCKVTERLGRRSHKVSQAIITPYPISNAVTGEDVKGTIIKYMFPCSGTVKKGLVDIVKKLESGAVVELVLHNVIHGETKTYIMTGARFIAEPNFEVDAGDKLTISIHPNSEEEKITEAWVSFMWVPKVSETEIKQCLIDSLDGGLYDLLEEGNEEVR